MYNRNKFNLQNMETIDMSESKKRNRIRATSLGVQTKESGKHWRQCLPVIEIFWYTGGQLKEGE